MYPKPRQRRKVAAHPARCTRSRRYRIETHACCFTCPAPCTIVAAAEPGGLCAGGTTLTAPSHQARPWRWAPLVLLVVAAIALVLVLRGSGRAPLPRRLRHGRPAGQGRPRAHRRHAGGDDHVDRADRRRAGRDRRQGRPSLRAAARGHHRDDPPDRPDQRRRPLRRHQPGADLPARARRRRDDQRRQDDADRRPRPAVQHVRRQDAQGPAAVHRRLGVLVRGQGAAGQRVGQGVPGRAVGPRPAGGRGERRRREPDPLPRQDRRRARRAVREQGAADRPGLQHPGDDGGAERQHGVAGPGAAARRAGAAQGHRRRSSRCVPRSRSCARWSTSRARRPRTSRPYARQLRPVLQQAVPTFRQLREMFAQPGASNDLLDALQELPALDKLTKTGFAEGEKSLKQGTPIFSFVRPYVPDLVGWVRDFGQVMATYDANGHYARTLPVFDAYSTKRRRQPDGQARRRSRPRRQPEDRPAAPLPGCRRARRCRTARPRSSTTARWPTPTATRRSVPGAGG